MSETIGYPDYQRVVDWDDPPFVATPERTLKEQTFWGPFNTSRFAYLTGKIGGVFLKGQVPIEWEFSWFMEEAVNTEVGKRVVMTHPSMGVAAYIHLPNLGPWLRVRASFVGLEAKTSVVLLPTNRVIPSEIVQQTPMVLPAAGAEIEKGASQTFAPTTYFSGPARMFIFNAGQEAVSSLQVFNPGEAWETTEQFVQPAATSRAVYPIVIPTAPFRVMVNNVGTAKVGMGVTVTGSTTGSL